MATVTVVCGPPGAGKTTYVRERAVAGDLIVDVDTLFAALSGQPLYQKPPLLLPYVLAARDGALGRLERGPAPAWVITQGVTAAERETLRARFAAEVVVLETPAITCLERIALDERRAGQLDEWLPRVLRWWREYEPSEADTVVKEG